MTNMDIRTEDGLTLRGTLFDAKGDRVLLIASAMGVKRRYYEAFAAYVADRGTSVVTFDYRGIGDSRPPSLRGFGATMIDWGRFDISAAIEWIRRELRPRTLTYAGHSCGGQLAGLAPNASAVDRFLFVSCQSGYWRHWPRPRAYGLHALWMLMPVVSRTIGFFPSRLFGLGSEDLPRGVASQWGRWGQRPEYLFAEVDPAPYARLTAPILAYSFRDDHYAPRPAVEALLSKYSGARITHRHVDQRGFGHFDFFRRSRRESHWAEAVEWIEGDRA